MTTELADSSYYEQCIRYYYNVEENLIVVFIFRLKVIKVNLDGLVRTWIALLLVTQPRQPFVWKVYHALSHVNVDHIEADNYDHRREPD